MGMVFTRDLAMTQHDYMQGYVDGAKETKAATIERCMAREDDAIEQCALLVERSNAFGWRTSLAAAIRALKDQP